MLVVEDDSDIASLVRAYLEREAIGADLAASAEEAERLMRASSYDLVLLDLNLPGMDGLAFLSRIRERSQVPVIIVSSRDSDEERIRGLGLGADDFIPKPFSPRVLAARVLAQLRREALRDTGETRVGYGIAFGACLLDRASRTLKRDGAFIALTRREYELLDFLACESGTSFGAEELFRRVWGKEYGDLSTVAVHVQRLRRKIEADPANPLHILTIPGLGYRFERGESGDGAGSKELGEPDDGGDGSAREEDKDRGEHGAPSPAGGGTA